MNSKLSRRNVIKYSMVAIATAPLLSFVGRVAAQAVLPPLDPNDATAKALGFVSDTTKVDNGANPTHKPAQKCGSCAQFQGKVGDKSGGCNIFAGHSVPEGGWCKVWAQKPA